MGTRRRDLVDQDAASRSYVRESLLLALRAFPGGSAGWPMAGCVIEPGQIKIERRIHDPCFHQFRPNQVHGSPGKLRIVGQHARIRFAPSFPIFRLFTGQQKLRSQVPWHTGARGACCARQHHNARRTQRFELMGSCYKPCRALTADASSRQFQ
jgi:hypothetical protein